MKKTERKRLMREVSQPSIELKLVLVHVQDPVNVGSAFRIADACGASELLLAGTTATPPNKLITRVGRAKDKRVPWRHVTEPAQCIYELRDEGFVSMGLEISAGASPYDTVSYPERLAIVVGAEEHGIPKKVLGLLDEHIFIPMLGKGGSLNVHVALGICAFHALSASRSQ